MFIRKRVNVELGAALQYVLRGPVRVDDSPESRSKGNTPLYAFNGQDNRIALVLHALGVDYAALDAVQSMPLFRVVAEAGEPLDVREVRRYVLRLVTEERLAR